MIEYLKLKEKHSKEYLDLNKQHNIISTIRLLIGLSFLFCLYFYFKTESTVLLSSLPITFLSFLFLMKFHQKLSLKRRIEKTLISINEDEIAYLKNESIPFQNGIEYHDNTHLYSHDLDIFGDNSLFQNLNRTATYIGKSKLAFW